MTADNTGAPLEAFASRWVVAVFALAGLVVGLIFFGLRDPVYESRTIVSVNNPLGTMGDEAALVLSDRVLSPAAATLGFRPKIEVEPNEVADLLSITVQANDPADAARAATQVAEVYVQSQTTVAARIADPAEPDPSPVAPNRLTYVLIGSGIGALVGAAIGSLRSLGKLVPQQAAQADRPAPIRPARRPSAEFAAAMATDPPPSAERAPTGLTGFDAGINDESVVAVSDPRDVVDDPLVDLRDRAPRRSKPVDSGSDTPPGPTTTTASTSTSASFSSAALSLHKSTTPPSRSEPKLTDPTPTTSQLADPTPADPIPDASLNWNDSTLTEPPAPAPTTPDVTSHQARPALAQTQSHDSLTTGRDFEDAQARYETLLNDQAISHAETLSSVEADYERDLSDLKRLLADARKQSRTSAAQIKRMSGDDQHRIGDLEAQATALDGEIATLRKQLESERIAHVRELTTERDTADRALDNARREFRSRVDANENQTRRTLSESRTELDELLTNARFEHQSALDRQHQEYEEALSQERDRHKADVVRLAARHREELVDAQKQADETGAYQARQVKQTVAELRASEKRLTSEVNDLHQTERQLRAELTTARKNHRHLQQQHTETEQMLRDELALTKKALQGEKERNAALRDDVVRRTAEAHQAVDQAIDDRSAKLAELEALVTRQREHAEQRVREANAVAEERARVSMRREAELSTRITRLERELNQLRPKTG